MVIDDIDLYDAAVADNAGLTLEAHDSFVIFGGVDAAERVFDGVDTITCALQGPHAHGNCMADAAATSTTGQGRLRGPRPR